jgi:deoxycytidine triphosphate deaminase
VIIGIKIIEGGIRIGILSGKEIEKRKNEIFESGFEPDCLGKASYNLRLNDTNMIINGDKFDENDTKHLYEETEDYKGDIVLPPRQISALSSIEKLNLSNNLCARVGIKFPYAKKGIIPLFGPQVDPGSNAYFYAVVYNCTEKPINLSKGEKLFKMEVHTIEGGVDTSCPSDVGKGISDIDKTITASDVVIDLIGEQAKINEAIEQLTKDIKETKTKVDEVESGYKLVTLFAIFLIAATILGVILTFWLR